MMLRTILIVSGVLCMSSAVAAGQGFTLAGQVSADKNAASIQLLLEDSKGKNPQGTRIEPDAGGNYVFAGLAGREYRLVAYVDGKKQDARKIEILCRPGATALKDFHFGKSESTLMLHYPAEDPDTIDIAQIQGNFPRDVQRDYDRAHEDYSRGNLRLAIERLEALAKRAPRYYKTHALLGLAYQDSGCYGDAEVEYTLASDVSPRAVHPLLNLASAQLRASSIPGQRDELLSRAVSTLEKASRVRPNSALVYCLMGSAHLRREALEEAEKSLLHALEIEPSLDIARLMLGNLYGKQKNWSAAAEQFRAYLDDNPFGANRGIVKEMLAQAEKSR